MLFRSEIYDAVMLLQPTCPFRKSIDINTVIKVISQGDVECVVSVTRVEDYHPGRMYVLEQNILKPYEENLISVNRQNLPHVYHRNGSIYCTRIEVIKHHGIYGKIILPYVMSRENSINIDDAFDWKIAELIIGNSGKK